MFQVELAELPAGREVVGPPAPFHHLILRFWHLHWAKCQDIGRQKESLSHKSEQNVL